MPKSEREETIAALTARIFSAMVNDLVMDATLQAHHEVARSRAICCVCNTHCGAVHTPAPITASASSSASQQAHTLSTSRQGSPASPNDVKTTNGSSGTGTNTPTSVKDGNSYLECLNCSRQIASNRYAPHLSTCMGLASARRGTARGNNKSKPPSETGRSPSPTSDAGAVSDDNPKTKGKGKFVNKFADEAEFKLKRKRLNSPQVSPVKNTKKQKTAASPFSKFKAKTETSASRNNSHHHSPSNSQSKVPSRLRESSTASFIGGSNSSSPSSRDSSPEVSAATPASSSFSHSPNLANRVVASKVKANGTGPPKRLSPPRPPPLHVPGYSIDVEGEETGSSTDTDSS